jgi:Clp amino terminal domain, pathogenicity island component
MEIQLTQLITGVEEGNAAPLDRVAAAAILKDQFEHLGDDLLDHFVQQARAEGCSWTQIGDALGVTRQAAQQRHSGPPFSMRSLANGPYKRFTPRASIAVIHAQTAARSRNHATLGTEHVLLGLFGANDPSVAVVALDRMGVDAARVTAAVDARVPAGETPVRGELAISPDAEEMFRQTLREALQLGHNYIGTEHLLLALRHGDGVAAQVLADLGVGEDELRSQVVTRLQEIIGST